MSHVKLFWNGEGGTYSADIDDGVVTVNLPGSVYKISPDATLRDLILSLAADGLRDDEPEGGFDA